MPREPVYTPSQAYTAESIFGSQFGSQELTRLDYAFEEDDEHVSTVEGNVSRTSRFTVYAVPNTLSY